tara:strand:- start:1512 stop:2480 length:969 start_codon:yes stop_codon:yes gene_type:complete
MLVKKCFENSWNPNVELNIVIPTYYRTENLIKSLRRLDECFQNNFNVIILDNDESDLKSDLLKFLKTIKFGLKFYKNNISTSGEISSLRLFELAQSKWIYLLGDSKLIKKNAIQIILRDIKNYNNYNGIIYSYDSVINKNVTVNSLNDFFKSGLKFGDFILMGNSLINKKSVKSHLIHGYNVSNSLTVPPAFHLLSLKENSKIFLSKDKIIQNVIEKPKHYNPGISLLKCWYSFPMLCILPFKRNYKKKISKMILHNENFKDYLIFIKFCLLKIFKEKKNISRELYLILKFRYIYSSFSIEKFFIIPLLIISKIKFINEKSN